MSEPALVGRRVQLTPVATRHYDLVYDWAARGEIPWQWRGRPVSPEGLRETMWLDCLFHYVVESRDRSRPIGLVSCSGASFHHQTCSLQVGLVERYRQRGWPFEAVGLALSVIFGRYNIRRVYAQATSATFEQFASGEGIWFEVEGRLRESVYENGRFLDTLILTVTRDRWESRIRPLVDEMAGVAAEGGPAVDGHHVADSFAGFVGKLRAHLNLRLDGVTPDLRFDEDLGFDSVAMFELLALLEEIAQRELPLELLDNVETLADAWSWYSTLVDQQRG